MKSEYRIPTIEEFVQGFKFQKLEWAKGQRKGRIAFLDPEYDKLHGRDIIAEEDVWYDVEVWWDKKPEWTTVDYEGISVTSIAIPEFDWLPWTCEGYIQKLINDGKVRCGK